MNKIKTVAAAICLSLYAGVSSAALPEGFSTSLTALQTDVVDLVELVYPFVLALIGVFLGIAGINYLWKLIRAKLGR